MVSMVIVYMDVYGVTSVINITERGITMVSVVIVYKVIY